jgi:hypothetical protein
MWTFNTDYNKWNNTKDTLAKEDFDLLKQELASTRFYSKCLSGASYVTINNLDNIYDVLGEYEPKNWFVNTSGSLYSNSITPFNYPKAITSLTSYDYYTKYLSEYGLTLKNKFTPERLIRDSVKNYIYVDVITTDQITLSSVSNLTIDGVRILEGHRVLVKNQRSIDVLPFNVDPKTYFKGDYLEVNNYGATIEYSYFNSENGVYEYINNILVRTDDLVSYEDCIRFSVIAKLGDVNFEKQFHLNRLLDGYFPVSGDPMEFIEKHNWLLRNQVDYNNLFEINYYDILKHGTQSYSIPCNEYYINGVTYSNITYTIPERSISIGEFGIILNTQSGVSNIIENKYKLNLRSISQTSTHYWIVGDSAVMLKVRKHDFFTEKIVIDTTTNITSISFYNNLRGVIVGDLNTILMTTNGGVKWDKIIIDDFESYYYNKVLYYNNNTIYIAGNSGVFIELKEDMSIWSAYKRRISREIDDYESYLLVDNINDIYSLKTSTWELEFSSFNTTSLPIEVYKELLFIVTDDSKVIIYDINNSIPKFDFIYLDFLDNYGNLGNITGIDSNKMYFSDIDGIKSFNLNDFKYIGVDNTYSNTISTTQSLISESTGYINKFYNYDNSQLIVCGNSSLLKYATFSNVLSFNPLDENNSFESRLKSKLLFLDYDIASKLNFFTDSGEYRLPVTSYIDTTLLDSLSFSPLYEGTEQEETNWLTYWKDTQKTFEYYSASPLDDSSKVLISTTFSKVLNSNKISVTSADISGDKKTVSNLAPSLLGALGRYELDVTLNSISYPGIDKKVFIYDYIMVIKWNSNVNIGDVLLIESSIFNTKLVVNRIEIINFEYYIYTYIDFNQNMITEFINTVDVISISNLNTFTNLYQLEDNFNLHPISNGYEISYIDTSNSLAINPKFNNLTSYYNLATSINKNEVIASTMSYLGGFLKFGYTPTYNILDYLEKLDSDLFNGDKEYFAMPLYNAIPVGILTPTTAYIDFNGLTYSSSSNSTTTGNKVFFGEDLKLEWESVFINTFIDISLYTSASYYDSIDENSGKYLTERLLVLKKYYDPIRDAYVIEFNKNMNYPLYTELNFIDIISRRKLSQISDDLQELNNIQTSRLKKKEIKTGYSFDNYERELNFKIPTDSYCKVLLSDVDTIEQLSAIIYIDDKNELSMNMTRLEKQYNISISNTSNFIIGTLSNLFISCSEKHDLKSGDGVVLEFTGTQSSLQLNQQYLGYHVVNVVNEYNFYIDIRFGEDIIADEGFVKYIKKDPFLNYTPVDIIDIGIDKKGKKSVELNPENLKLTDDVYSLINIDFEKYRFRLVDGLTVETLSSKYPWILDAEISDAIIGIDGGLVWYKGIWKCGRWFSGRWVSGTWESGDWYGGTWDSRNIKDNLISIEVDSFSSNNSYSTWINGRWYDGTWNNGRWINGRWYDGSWNNGKWYKGTWNNGTWNNGQFSGGIWINGTWNNGILNSDNEVSYWLDGKWNGGDFENGIWSSGVFEEKNAIARFGTKSYNSRTAIWKSGQWLSGSFYSRINIDENGVTNVSNSHKYSIWQTGSWNNGSWYGGIAYNINFKSGTWNGGILDEIQVIKVNNNSLVLNGIFKFSIGNDINIISNDGISSTFKILLVAEEDDNKTIITIKHSYLITSGYSDTGLRLVSVFTNSNWKSGIWTNGIYNSGLWEGGIWYNGIFNGNWIS